MIVYLWALHIDLLVLNLSFKYLVIKEDKFPLLMLQMPPPKKEHGQGDNEKEAKIVKYVYIYHSIMK